ncbi:MAG: ABC transporter ATP-binding protein [Acidimicrobiales bacterium]
MAWASASSQIPPLAPARPTSPSRAVEVNGLTKRYPKSPANAVDEISFAVASGEVFGLLGPNGAGKTTTVGILTTRVLPSAGSAVVGGVDVIAHPVAARAQLAVVPQRSNLDRSLSIRDNLIFHAAYHGVPAAERGRRADALLEQFGLLERAGQKPDFFSGGQSQRVMIARALMHAPRVLFLDEPSTGLDPAARLFLWDRLEELKERGVTIVLTTHSMDEAATLSDRVGIMDHGKLLALDTPPALIRSLPGSATLDLTTEGGNPSAAAEALADLGRLGQVERAEEARSDGTSPSGTSSAGAVRRMRMYVTGDAPALVAPAAAVLAEHGLRLTEVGLGTSTLEDVFIHLTGRALR